MKLLKQLLICTLLLTAGIVNAQLNNFNLEVSKVDETCPGNGSLTFAVNNTAPGAAILYKVYQLPDTNNPVAIQEGTHLGSLTSATYRVIAIQALGDQQNTQQKDITIIDNVGNFNFTAASSNTACSDGGSITITATVGIASQYEIISGPVTRPLQTSNVFTNMPAGTYNIRVYNNCGQGKVKSYTLNLIEASLNISDTAYPEMTNPVCDQILISNTITPTAGSISYPLTVKHTLDPIQLGGAETVITQVFQTGDAESLTVTALVPRYLTENYGYTITVTDNCNAVYTKEDGKVEAGIEVSIADLLAECGEKYLSVTPSKHRAPYTVVVTGPEGFTASAFNPQNQGPFSDTTVTYGSPEQTIPFGMYTVTVTDMCGRTVTDSLDVIFTKPEASLKGTNNGCFSLFGKIKVSVPDHIIVTITMTAAPDAYNFTGPIDFTSSLSSNGTLTLNDMPIGEYKFIFTDECGNEYEEKVKVPPFVQKEFNVATLPGCEAGFGTIRFRSGNGDLMSARIMEVQGAAYNQQLPQDVTQYLVNGDLYMDSLPAGIYTFEGTDICGIVEAKTIDVEGYTINSDIYTYTPKCGSFSIKVTDTGNGTEEAQYWLQKYYPETGKWGHPNGNGNAYTEGTAPTTSNAVKLTNNTQRNNLNYTGTFRIIKKFETFTTGSKENTVCISQLGNTFYYEDGFWINAAYSLACVGKPNDIYLDVQGFPVAYRIIKKNDVSFTMENGTNNVFIDLEPATYMFEIENECGDTDILQVNIETLPAIVTANKPDDMLVCNKAGFSPENYLFHLTDQDKQILGDQHSASYTITYHISEEDAYNAVNPLPEDYTNLTNGQTVYFRIVHNEIDICPGTGSFQLFIGEDPKASVIVSGIICDGGSVMLSVDKAASGYLWSTGETTRSITVSEPGEYTVTVTRDYGNRTCTSEPVKATVNGSVTPAIAKVITADWTEEENSITVHTKEAGNFEYSIDGINYQRENTFTNLKTGVYKVFVKDDNGCGLDMQEVVLMYYPNYFTPNNDGHHDKWRLPYAIMEPNIKIDLFDRYGKHVTSFGATSEGWDGTMNGQNLPSTDYWFVVTREDGRELRGHFAMIR